MCILLVTCAVVHTGGWLCVHEKEDEVWGSNAPHCIFHPVYNCKGDQDTYCYNL